MAIDRVAVLGGGLMGSGIAESVARAGMSVVVRDVDATAFEAARGRIEGSLGRSRERGKIEDDAYAEILGRISFTDRLEDIADADLVVEAVPENADLKAAILGQVAGIVSEDALIASNTSSIPIAQLAAGLPRPERVLGLHFFSPVPVMRLVEIVVALDTSEETVASGPGLRRAARQAGDHHQGPLRLHRQHAARPLPDGGGADVRRRLRHRRGHRRGDEARLRPPDGPADAGRLHRPRRPLRDRRLPLRGVQADRVRAAAADQADGRLGADRSQGRARLLRVPAADRRLGRDVDPIRAGFESAADLRGPSGYPPWRKLSKIESPDGGPHVNRRHADGEASRRGLPRHRSQPLRRRARHPRHRPCLRARQGRPERRRLVRGGHGPGPRAGQGTGLAERPRHAPRGLRLRRRLGDRLRARLHGAGGGRLGDPQPGLGPGLAGDVRDLEAGARRSRSRSGCRGWRRATRSAASA